MDITNDSKLCACGCGESLPANWKPPARDPNRKPPRFIAGHNCRVMRTRRPPPPPPNPGGRPDGYVRVHRDTRLLLGHVAVFEEYREKIPEGMTLDHLCRTRNCVNPAHMEVVTLAENNRRRAQEETDLFTIDDISYTIDEVTGCWNATRVQRDGYARVFVGGNVVAAHRIMYVRHRGNFAKWQQLDHLCRNKACLNPAHLEPVSRIENVRRAINAKTKFNVA